MRRESFDLGSTVVSGGAFAPSLCQYPFLVSKEQSGVLVLVPRLGAFLPPQFQGYLFLAGYVTTVFLGECARYRKGLLLTETNGTLIVTIVLDKPEIDLFQLRFLLLAVGVPIGVKYVGTYRSFLQTV